MSLQAIRYDRGSLQILDQLLLPDETHYFPIHDTIDGWKAIKKMQVRGAPAIAIVGCLSLAVELHNQEFTSVNDLEQFVVEKLNYLTTSRPTAVNMAEAAARGKDLVQEVSKTGGLNPTQAKIRMIESFEEMLQTDIDVNKRIGKFGAEHILHLASDRPVNMITHCNTGSLATAGYGTALGIIRCLSEKGKIKHVYFTETRPYNQGARLTAYELLHEKIPSSLICDSMVAACMKNNQIDAVVVGADRVVANGDTANKIGTYQLAIVAQYHKVPFYVACPRTTFDATIDCGENINIEERPHHEMTSIKGISIAASGVGCWNPAFDVAPADLITGGIVTEFGVFRPDQVKHKFEEFKDC